MFPSNLCPANRVALLARAAAGWLPRLIALVLALSLAACSRESEALAAGPVQECLDYERAVASCFHRDVSIASQESLVPKTRADQEEIRQLCNQSLKQIRHACR